MSRNINIKHGSLLFRLHLTYFNGQPLFFSQNVLNNNPPPRRNVLKPTFILDVDIIGISRDILYGEVLELDPNIFCC